MDSLDLHAQYIDNKFMTIIPAPLNKGDMIGVMSPSSFITQDDVDKAKAIVEGYGYKVYIHPQTTDMYNQSAGTNTEKLNAFHDLVSNPDIKAIIFSTGGNRAMHWVDDIDFDLVKSNPKIMMGFSDITSILNVINKKIGLRTFHGPNLRWFMVHENNQDDINQCFDVLSQPDRPHYYACKMAAPLVGGNLSLIQYLTNDIDFNGKTLFIEGWNTEYSYLDRTFCHMRRQGVFQQIEGLIIGQFDNLTDTGRPYGFTFDDIIAEHVPDTLPLIQNAPFGHGDRLITLPIG